VISFADIEAARKRIAGSVFLSPCAYSEVLSKATDTKLWLKLENLQMTGSFKERGACNKLMTLTAEERARGVICASAGNHAQGVAYHAQRLGIDATIVMPEVTPLVKVQSTRGFGGRIVLHGANYDEAYEKAKEIEAAEKRVFVHPFDDELVMAGQGTIGLELLEQNPYLEAVIVAIGGGGLAAGVAVAIKETNPRIKVYGVETSVLASMKVAIENGGPVTLPAARTIAEGIAVRRAGNHPFEVVRKYVDDIVLVDEEEIAEAILTLLEREKTVAEGAGAAPLAALLHKRIPGIFGKKVAVIVCGGNIDVNVISRIIDRGLVKSGRMVRFVVTISDISGSLARLTRLVADAKASVVQIHHDRTFATSELNEAVVELVLETRGFAHVEEVRGALVAGGYKVQ
jgi:threonine dehydratase